MQIPKIIVEILDYWVEDSIDRGCNPMKLHVLMKMNNTLKLLTKDIEEN